MDPIWSYRENILNLKNIIYYHIYLRKSKCMNAVHETLYLLFVKFMASGPGLRPWSGPIWPYSDNVLDFGKSFSLFQNINWKKKNPIAAGPGKLLINIFFWNKLWNSLIRVKLLINFFGPKLWNSLIRFFFFGGGGALWGYQNDWVVANFHFSFFCKLIEVVCIFWYFERS